MAVERKEIVSRQRNLPRVVRPVGYQVMQNAYATQMQTGGTVSKFAKELKSIGDDGYIAKLKNSASRKAIELRQTHRNDPEGFDNSWNIYKTAQLQIQETERPFLGDRPGVLLDEIGISGFNIVYDEHQKNIFDDNKQQIKNSLETTTAQIQRDIAQGNVHLSDLSVRLADLDLSMDNAKKGNYFYPEEVSVLYKEAKKEIITSLTKKTLQYSYLSSEAREDLKIDDVNTTRFNFEISPKKTVINAWKAMGANDEDIEIIESIFGSEAWKREDINNIAEKAHNHVVELVRQSAQKLKLEEILEKEKLQIKIAEIKKNLQDHKGLNSSIKQAKELRINLIQGGDYIANLEQISELTEIIIDAEEKRETGTEMLLGERQGGLSETDTGAIESILYDLTGEKELFANPTAFGEITTFVNEDGNVGLTDKGKQVFDIISRTSVPPKSAIDWVPNILSEDFSNKAENFSMALLLSAADPLQINRVLDQAGMGAKERGIITSYLESIKNGFNNDDYILSKSNIAQSETLRQNLIKIQKDKGLQDRYEKIKENITEDTVKQIFTKAEDKDVVDWEWLSKTGQAFKRLLPGEQGRYSQGAWTDIKDQNYEYQDFDPHWSLWLPFNTTDFPDVSTIMDKHGGKLVEMLEDNLAWIDPKSISDPNYNIENLFKDKAAREKFGELLRDNISLVPTKVAEEAIHNVRGRLAKNNEKVSHGQFKFKVDEEIKDLRGIKELEFPFSSIGSIRLGIPGFKSTQGFNAVEWAWKAPDTSFIKEAQSHPHYKGKTYDPRLRFQDWDIAGRATINRHAEVFYGRLHLDKKNNRESPKPGGGVYTKEERDTILKNGLTKLQDKDFFKVIEDLDVDIAEGIYDEDHIYFPIMLASHKMIEYERVGDSNQFRPYYISRDQDDPGMIGTRNYILGSDDIYKPDYDKSIVNRNTIINRKNILEGELDHFTFFQQKIAKLVKRENTGFLSDNVHAEINSWLIETVAHWNNQGVFRNKSDFLKHPLTQNKKNWINLIWGKLPEPQQNEYKKVLGDYAKWIIHDDN